MKELLDSHRQKGCIMDNFQKFVFNWSTTTTSNAIEAAIKFSFTRRGVTFSIHQAYI
jgi:UDP-N-acetylglucosamine transferase subunit ALG13